MARDYSKRQQDKLVAILTVDPHPQQFGELIGCLQEAQNSRLDLARLINYPFARHKGRTAVHLAASKGLWQCLEVLLKHGGNPNAVSSLVDLGQTPLHLASREGNGKCVEVLLENGGDLWLETARKETVLSLARNKYCCTVIEHMNAKLQIPQRSRAEEELVKDLHQLARMKQNITFFQAYTNLAPAKVDLGTRWNDCIKTPSSQTLLYTACKSRAYEIVQYMLSSSSSQPLPNLEDDESPLHAVSEISDHNIASMLLNHSPKLVMGQRKMDNKTPLHIACLNGDHRMVDIVLDHIFMLVDGQNHVYSEDDPFSLDMRDSYGVTPFYLACLHGFPKVVKELLTFKSHPRFSRLITLDVNSIVKHSDHTSLHATACSGNSELVTFLLSLEEIKRDRRARPLDSTEKKLLAALQSQPNNDRSDTGKCVCESPSGALVIGEPGQTKQNKPLFLTPLAEACIHNKGEVVDTLLKHEIRDADGLACRVSLVTNNYHLAQKILSYECAIRKEKSSKDERRGGGKGTGIDFWSLKLHWGEKKLSEIRKEWLNSEAVFNPTYQGEELDEVRGRRQGKRDSPIASLHSQLPEKIDHTFIRFVTLKSNALQRVPLELFLLKNVIKIDLSENCLVSLPTRSSRGRSLWDISEFCGWECTQLSELKLSHNQLTRLPLSVWVLPRLVKLIANNNKLETLKPSNTFSTLDLSKTLSSIDFSSNKLSTIEPFISELQALKIAVFTRNKLTTIPENLWLSPTLEELHASNNDIISLVSLKENEEEEKAEEEADRGEVHVEPSVENTKPLIKMHMEAVRRSTRVTEARARFRSQISRFPSIDPQQSVDLDGSTGHCGNIDKLTQAQEYIDVGEAQEYSKLAKLDISNNKFEKFPDMLPCMAPSLVELNISNNPVGDVEIRFLPPSLKKLKAKNCGIVKFGSTHNSEQLKAVIQTCDYKEFDDQPCSHRHHQRLQNLSSLILSHNQITHFQVFYHKLPHKGTPNFGKEENEYRSTVSVTDILYPSLDNLDLSHNNLQGVFNPNTAHFASIKTIDLSHNENLQKIPYELGLLKRCKDFTLLDISSLSSLIEPPKTYQTADLTSLLTFLAAGLKNSEVYRTIKLFLVGRGQSGKTTLLRRLRSISEPSVERTEGIDIIDFTYTPARSHLFGKSSSQKPIQFLAWDFAGQEAYHTTHQCFYSQRSIYLAIFPLTHGERGVKELDIWLRNIELRARGCPVVIVGTHMDLVDRATITHLEELAKKTYSNKKIYPEVVEVVSVSGIHTSLFANNGIESLRKTIYTVATHLQLCKDGKLVYKPDMKEDDPKALFMERVPKSFIDLQSAIHQYVDNCQEWWQEDHECQQGPYQHCKKEPVMTEEEFRENFSELFNNDREELDEAVSFLNLQGERNRRYALLMTANKPETVLYRAPTFSLLLVSHGTLLHFVDHGLKDLYFLDPQWLAKLMAHVIHPYAVDGDTPVVKGIIQIAHLFWNLGISDSLKLKYIELLEKFEVALKISSSQVLIPSLMPDHVVYPQPNDDLHDILLHIRDEFHQPALRRFWLVDYVPEGFWPRLICRIATDKQIEQTLKMVIGEDDGSTPLTFPDHVAMNGQPSELLKWKPWKKGVAFSHRGRTLLVVKEEDNSPPATAEELGWLEIKSDGTPLKPDREIEWLPAKKRIEIHVYAPEWLNVLQELELAGRPTKMLKNPISLPGIATRILVKISQHLLSLAHGWFHGVLSSKLIYIPCWKCYGRMPMKEREPVKEREEDVHGVQHDRYFPMTRMGEKFPVFSFIHEKCIIPAGLEEDLHCSVHGPIKVIHTAPDLIFWDLASLSAYSQDMMATLDIKTHETLGKGGYGFVCKGELISPQGKRKKVAVKGFLSNPEEAEHYTIAELLEKSKQPENLYQAYKEIRQEVSFLAVLDHPNLTKLCGVRTSPYMCLLLELAPRGSLRGTLKQYWKHGSVLEPLSLQLSIAQIANGLEYLHMSQIVHLDMKSPNVLVWQFPSGQTTRSNRIEQAGNVWLKLADYGISQVSTKKTIKVTTNQPQGTSGYIPPELFGVIGGQISSEKVDVFAFGMVVYELISLHSPFENINPMMRNRQVKENRRPALKGNGVWTLVQAQDIMRICWAQDPDARPTMKQLTQWVNMEEFGRLRAEISLEAVERISCASVCRICPEDEYEFAAANGHSPHAIGTIPEERSFNNFFDEEVDSPMMDDMAQCVRFSRLQNIIPTGIPHQENILPPMDEHTELRIRADSESFDQDGENDDIYRFLPHSQSREEQSKQRKPMLQPYTQVWVCDSKERGLLQIFTYYDSQPGYYVYAGHSRDQILAICPVRNMMWIGTTNGILKLKHAPTLVTKFKGKLKTETTPNPFILNITHVDKTSSVLVTTSANDIWVFHDKLSDKGLVIEDHLMLPNSINCYQLAMLEVGGSLEVWGTMDRNQLLLLEKKRLGWEMQWFHVKSKQEWQFFHIGHATFEDKSGQIQNHLWASYRQKSHLVCWNVQDRQLLTTLDTTSLKLNSTKTTNPKVTALTASGKKVIVGTDFGTVGIIDSELSTVLHCLQWHTEKVRTLLLMPYQMEPCICSEIPLPEVDTPSFSKLHRHNRNVSDFSTEPELISLVENPYSLPNEEPHRTMVASIGNGRKRFIDEGTTGNDVRLLVWRC